MPTYSESYLLADIGDQADATLLEEILADSRDFQGYDVIIDDGGHTANQMLTSIKVDLSNWTTCECELIFHHQSILSSGAAGCILRAWYKCVRPDLVDKTANYRRTISPYAQCSVCNHNLPSCQ